MENFPQNSFMNRSVIDNIGLSDVFKTNASLFLGETNSVRRIEQFFIGTSNTAPLNFTGNSSYENFPFDNATFSTSNSNLFTFDKENSKVICHSFRGVFGIIIVVCDLYGAETKSLQGLRINVLNADGVTGPIGQTLITTEGTSNRYNTSCIARPIPFTLKENYDELVNPEFNFQCYAINNTAKFIAFKAFGLFMV